MAGRIIKGIVVAPKEFVIFDICLWKSRFEWCFQRTKILPLLIIYAHVRGADRSTDGMDDYDTVVRLQRITHADNFSALLVYIV